MTRDELIRLSAEKVLREESWESIEYLFKPVTAFELLLRLDFEGMQKKISDWFFDDSPDAMPHRFRSPYLAQMQAAVDVEKFYREMQRIKGELNGKS